MTTLTRGQEVAFAAAAQRGHLVNEVVGCANAQAAVEDVLDRVVEGSLAASIGCRVSACDFCASTYCDPQGGRSQGEALANLRVWLGGRARLNCQK